MQIKASALKGVLLMNKVTTAEALEALSKEAAEAKVPLEKLVVDKKLISERDLVKLYARSIGVPYVDLAGKQVPASLLKRIPERIAKASRAVIFGEEDERLLLAMEDPEDFQSLDTIEKQTGYRVKVYMATPSDIDGILGQYGEGLDTEIRQAIKETEAEAAELPEETTAQQVEEVVADAPIARAVSIILEYAVKSRASDIHIEPREDAVHVRYRIDGILHDTMTLPKALLPAIVSRIKVLSDLKIDEHRIPQDGRFKITVGDKKMSLRVSTLPILDGEKVVMRLLDESAKALTLEELGFTGRSLEIIKNGLTRAQGMTLVTGPTGSGKSTTLYSILSMINTAEINISTVEDPVEYRVPGVNQTQANQKVGMTFANGLRALLRQDPDVIMVGEIRDGETAEIAIHAALTGHVVLSTLHTNSAGSTLPRLLDMGAEPFLIASTVNTIVAQRLVRVICPDCKEAFHPTVGELEAIKREFDLAAAQAHLASAAPVAPTKDVKPQTEAPAPTPPLPADGDERTAAANTEASSSESVTLYRGKGCAKCSKTGYKGRRGIYEVLEVTEPIQSLIIGKGSAEQLQQEAVKAGMITMKQDGLIKALQGTTTIEEVLRVTKEH
jgi:type IV pilus assembly protein PilB